MLFAVRMSVALPPDMDEDVQADILTREKTYSQDLQNRGEWQQIWRCVGQYSNLSIFDVADNERLHSILWNLPLFPYLDIEVTPLARHPSRVSAS
ncbi:muconolactone Delta-isomerase [Cryobacterium sp. PH31-O1]|uniref:muconolactone Delta-isomerase n=1 Tax=Cryobacterium sp. PH31-O1 TaxID=3046306 RepID=UPI0024BB9833|nr:muconolactone Delta-isomerase [Cryobacterium sp. PH31-O1]MDJ0339669.1 muconolactone Delta-isomerase [Cryobacterium sp. PH31-O1]